MDKDLKMTARVNRDEEIKICKHYIDGVSRNAISQEIK